jgi:hypothetical protein
MNASRVSRAAGAIESAGLLCMYCVMISSQREVKKGKVRYLTVGNWSPYNERKYILGNRASAQQTFRPDGRWKKKKASTSFPLPAMPWRA